jgi:hypothetical protein
MAQMARHVDVNGNHEIASASIPAVREALSSDSDLLPVLSYF